MKTYTIQVTESLEKAIEEQTPFGVNAFYNRLELWSKEGVQEIPLTYSRAIECLKRKDVGKQFKPFVFNFEV
jgi:hypothetical protein